MIVSDDRPLTRREYYQALAASIGATVAFAEPPIEQTKVSQHSNKRCSNRKLRDEWKVELAYPTFFVGMPDAVKA
ncbi:MAG TPA: hypothetical protein EYP14_20720 [Planctomycetaceae bacterium]|nr:hypothetical protein [Planctomycetaceae bacterium]